MSRLATVAAAAGAALASAGAGHAFTFLPPGHAFRIDIALRRGSPPVAIITVTQSRARSMILFPEQVVQMRRRLRRALEAEGEASGEAVMLVAAGIEFTRDEIDGLLEALDHVAPQLGLGS